MTVTVLTRLSAIVVVDTNSSATDVELTRLSTKATNPRSEVAAKNTAMFAVPDMTAVSAPPGDWFVIAVPTVPVPVRVAVRSCSTSNEETTVAVPDRVTVRSADVASDDVTVAVPVGAEVRLAITSSVVPTVADPETVAASSVNV